MRTARHIAPAFTLLVAILAAGVALADSREKEAERAALRWLSAVDRGRYEQSWERASQLVQRQVPKERWVDAVSGLREPLGSVQSRTLGSATYRESIPGAPDGEYMVLRFDTVFEKKRQAIETITQMLVGDEWRVSGYFIH